MPRCRCGSVEMENVGFDKMHIVSLYLRQPADTLCDHIYPHMGKGVVMWFAHFCMGYLNNGDDSVSWGDGSVTYPLTRVLAHWWRIEGCPLYSAGQNYESSHLGSEGLDWVSMESVIWAGSCTSMRKWEAMVGDSTSHTPCMAGRGWHDELPDGCGKSVLPLQSVKLFE